MFNKNLFLTIPLLAFPLAAQPPKSQALLMALGANGKQMTAYQWKQKVTVFRKGAPAGVFIEELRFDATGQLQRTVLSKPEEKRMGPLRAHKVAEVKESVQEVMRLAGRYANPQTLAQAIQKGEVWEGPNSLRVQSRSVILPADEMTLTFSASSFLATRADIKTRHDGEPVSVAIDYQQLPNGPSMTSRMTVQIPEDAIVVNVESYDFVRLANFNQ